MIEVRSYLLLSVALVVIPSHRVVGDVEGVVSRWDRGVGAAFHHEGVLLATHHRHLGDQQAVDVPGDAPAHVTCTTMDTLRVR